MDRSEFLEKANRQINARNYNDELIPIMEIIKKYYEELARQVNDGKIEKPFNISGDSDILTAYLNGNSLTFTRKEEFIEVLSKNVECEQKVIDRIIIKPNCGPTSENLRSGFNYLTMENYLPYFLNNN